MLFKKLIVGVDFSPASERAIAAAVSLAKGLTAEVVLVHAISASAAQADARDAVDDLRPAIERQLRDLCSLHASSGVKLDWGVVEGDAAHELVTFASAWSGDMIIVSTQGRSGVARVMLGSVAEKVVRNAGVPVLVVGPKA